MRELQNLIERAVIMSRGDTLELDRAFGVASQPKESTPDSLKSSLVTIERQRIVDVLEACRWKIKGDGNAASRLGINLSTLRSRMKILGIARP